MNTRLGTTIRVLINGKELKQEVKATIEFGDYNLAIVSAIYDDSTFDWLRPLISEVINFELHDNLNNTFLQYKGEAVLLKQKLVCEFEQPIMVYFLFELLDTI